MTGNPHLDSRYQAKLLYWQGWRVSDIAKELGVKLDFCLELLAWVAFNSYFSLDVIAAFCIKIVFC